MQISFEVDSEYFKALAADLNTEDKMAILANSLAALKWVVEQKKENRKVVSINQDGQPETELSLPCFEPKA